MCHAYKLAVTTAALSFQITLDFNFKNCSFVYQNPMQRYEK